MTLGQEPACLTRIKSPAGDCVTLTSYQEYVCRMLREELTMDEVRDLLDHFHCRIEELVDKILESRMVGKSKKRKVR